MVLLENLFPRSRPEMRAGLTDHDRIVLLEQDNDKFESKFTDLVDGLAHLKNAANRLALIAAGLVVTGVVNAIIGKIL